MNGVHDLGGMENLGPIDREENEPVFHADWEKKVLSLMFAVKGAGYFVTDEMRRTIELLPPARYLSASYYEKWFMGFSSMLLEKDILTREELETGKSIREEGGTTLPALEKEKMQFAMANPIPHSLDIATEPKFKAGDQIITKNMHPKCHTRIPRYIRGRRGVVIQDHGVFPLPDSIAHGGPDKAQHCYSVRFTARELWGEEAPAKDSLYIDLFDDYMELQD